MNKILFFGTSGFAVPSLEHLYADGHFEIVGVVTQPDRAVGRHATITAPPIKITAEKLGIKEIRQPEKIKDEDFATWIKTVGRECDAFVVVSYGKILPQWLLDIPKKGVINVHGSLLPRWRGASPIQAAIAAGDAASGVSIMLLDAEMDHGPVLAMAEEPIHADDIGQTLHDRIAALGGGLVPSILKNYLTGDIEPQPQDHDLATYCKPLTRDDGKLDLTKTAEELERQIRAYTPWPGTWTEWNGRRLKVLAARVGTGALALTCGNNTSLELTRVQPEGKNPMSGEDFLRGLHAHEN